MAPRWILCVVLFAGSISAFQNNVHTRDLKSASPTNVLQEYPSVVQIDFYFFWSTAQWSKQCVGSIITARLILSAASCFTGWSFEPRFRRFRAGSGNANTGGLINYMDYRINYPEFYQVSNYNGDISVVRLRTALVYTPLIRQAIIASPGSIIPNNLLLNQVGFGRNEQTTLTAFQVYTTNRDRCARRDDVISPLNFTIDILCAMPFGANQNSNDDVGSPWFFGNITVGIAGGVNTQEAYNGILAAPLAKYTEWIINIASSL